MYIIKPKQGYLDVFKVAFIICVIIYIIDIIREPTVNKILLSSFISIVGLYYIWFILDKRKMIINENGIKVERQYVKLFGKEFPKSYLIKWHEITSVNGKTPNFLDGCDIVYNQRGVRGEIFFTQEYENAREAMIFIERHVRPEIIDAKVKKFIEQYKTELGSKYK